MIITLNKNTMRVLSLLMIALNKQKRAQSKLTIVYNRQKKVPSKVPSHKLMTLNNKQIYQLHLLQCNSTVLMLLLQVTLSDKLDRTHWRIVLIYTDLCENTEKQPYWNVMVINKIYSANSLRFTILNFILDEMSSINHLHNIV